MYTNFSRQNEVSSEEALDFIRAEDYNTSMKKIIFVAALAAVLLYSCASVKFVQKEGDIQKIVELINAGDHETLGAVSAAPFLFDSEILMLDADIKSLWRNLTDAGFALPGAAVAAIEERSEGDFAAFGDTMDVKTYFTKYLPETARIAVVRAGGMELRLLVNGKVDGYPKVYGMRVE